jgi:hypothetical protein
MRERVSARRWLEAEGPGDPTKYIRHALRDLRLGDRVVLWLRVSIGQNKAHLDDQERQARLAVADIGACVVAVVRHVGRGYDDPYRDGPCWAAALSRAACIARQHGAVLLATETDRFVRHPAYGGKKCADLQARTEDLDELRCCTNGVKLLTLARPDAPPGETRGWQTRRGMAARPQTKRAGYKRRRRETKRPLVLQLRAAGIALSETVRLTGVPRRTVSRWIKTAEV